MRTRKNSWVLWAAALVSIGIYASNAKAVFYTEQYEMTASPDTVPGTVNGHTLLVATGSGTNGPSGSTFAGGIMTFLDNNLSSGNQGFYIGSGNTGGAWMGASSNFNVDFYMRVLQSNEPSGGGAKSFGFKSGNQRGLQMKLDRATFVNGTNPVDTAGFADLTVWRQYRVIVNGASSTAVLYTSTDGDVNNGNGDNVAFASTNMGGSGAAGEITGIGFNIGSLGGSSTTLANFDLDWFRVETGTSDPQAHWDLVPEPATLGLLALGCVPLVMRRRR